MVPPGHGAFGTVELQLPLPAVVTVAARPIVMDKNSTATKATVFKTNGDGTLLDFSNLIVEVVVEVLILRLLWLVV